MEIEPRQDYVSIRAVFVSMCMGMGIGRGQEGWGEGKGRYARQYWAGAAKRPPPPPLKTCEIWWADSARRFLCKTWGQGFRVPSGARMCICTRLSFI